MIDPVTFYRIEQYRLREAYVFSDKTISIDLSKFESGESNILLIAGLPASGKTTLGMKLAKKYNATIFKTDECLNEGKGLNNKVFKDAETCYRDSFISAKKSAKRYVMEGVLVYWSCIKLDNKGLTPFFNQQKDAPVIILGTSVIKTFWQGWQRDKDEESLRDIYKWYIKNNIKDNKVLNIYKQARGNVPDVDIKEYKF